MKNRTIPGIFGYNGGLQTGAGAVLETPPGVTWKVVTPMPDHSIPSTTEDTTEDRFWAKTIPDGECVRWVASFNNKGYGQFNFRGTMHLAHRVAYVLAKGDIPAGLIVRHSCDNRWCVNPQHLLLGTHRDNMRDAVDRQRMASGDRNGLRRRPDRNPMVLYPDSACRGERNGNAKLTTGDVESIRELLADDLTKSEVARRFGVSRRTIRAIAKGETWQV